MTLTIDSTIRLAGGIDMPVLGLGVYQARGGSQTRNAVRWALEAGYRHVDTATLYANERDVGEALGESGIPREEVFVTTKLWNDDHGYDAAIAAFEASRQRLGLDYLDLYLLHWPVQGLRRDSWRALETLLADGKCRAIGVSNYTIRHLEEMLSYCSTVPAVDQVEFSPYLYQIELLEFCRAHQIQIEAYSPLTKGMRLGDAALVKVASKYDRSPAQILIRWALQHDLVVIPKSVTQSRIVENARVFDLEIASEDMAALDALNEDLHTSWDPTDAP